MTFPRRTLALPIALAATLALASCGTSSDGGQDVPGATGRATSTPAASSSSATGAKVAADVDFATMMIPHHAQAMVMADLALKQATDAKVKALATRIRAAQGPEIARMSGWLTGWGSPVPGDKGGHGMHGMHGMNGNDGMGERAGRMMSTQEMTDLGNMTGSAFDRKWLQMMVRHHMGAVAVARTELAQGANAEGKQLARSVIASQSAEITQMSSILNRISG